MIPVNEPIISKNAQKYVVDCIKSGWVSSAGIYIERFENEFSKFLGVKYAVTTTNGTAALHLALAALGIGPGDEVIIPDLTIISCALAVIYTGATPVLVDVDPVFGNIDPSKIETKITKKTKAIMVVHLYGHPADMDPIIRLAKKHKLKVIEDAAEAHGAEVRDNPPTGRAGRQEKFVWKKVGGIGDIGCFSFYGNKIITTGEGGMVVTNNKKIFERLKHLKDLAHSKRRFVHDEIGFNYRMTNLQAALGVAQLEEVEKYIQKKRWMAKGYLKRVKDIPELELPIEAPWAKSVYWMFAVRVQAFGSEAQARRGTGYRVQDLRKKLLNLGVDTREFFYPLHLQPALKKLGLFKGESYPVSLDLSQRGFYIPSGLAITLEQIEQVSNALKEALNG